MTLFVSPEHSDETYMQRLGAVSMGALVPATGQVIRGGVYDSLILGNTVSTVTLQDVVILGHVVVAGLGVSGTIYVPVVGTGRSDTVELGPNPLKVQRKSAFILARMAGIADDEGDPSAK